MAKGTSDATKRLGEIRQEIGRTIKPFVQRDAIQTLGGVGFKLAQDGLRSGQNPGGRAWAPLKNGGGTALRSLVGTLTIRFGFLTFTVIDRVAYAAIHQKGAKNKAKPNWRLPVRRLLPKKAVPKQWADPMVRALETKIRSLSAKLTKGSRSGTVKV